MKASVKFRDDQKPLARAKVPLSVVGLPLLSRIAAGETNELRLDLATAFDSGPSLRLSYSPNDTWNPFTLAVKTGTGSFGSPVQAPISMTAEFSFLGRGSPAFSLQFRPRVGDFAVRKVVTSGAESVPRLGFGAGVVVGEESEGESSSMVGGAANGMCSAGKQSRGFPMGIRACSMKAIDSVLAGLEVTARSVFPLWDRANVKFRWGLTVPDDLHAAFRGGTKCGANFPIMVMRKVSIEQVVKDRKAVEEGKKGKEDFADSGIGREVCSFLSKELDELHCENRMLRRGLEELHLDLSGFKESGPSIRKGWNIKGGEDERSGWKGGNSPRGDQKGAVPLAAPAKDEVNEELKKAIMAKAGSGGK